MGPGGNLFSPEEKQQVNLKPDSKICFPKSDPKICLWIKETLKNKKHFLETNVIFCLTMSTQHYTTYAFLSSIRKFVRQVMHY